MITAVDTNVLIDVLANDVRYAERSLAALRACQAAGPLVVCEIVAAEVGRYFDSLDELQRVFTKLRMDACFLAGQAFRTYRRQGGARDRVLADFLIGAHARIHAAHLLTRDRGFYRAYFAELKVLDPATDDR
jgi:predicted nucleic acid-binding protein